VNQHSAWRQLMLDGLAQQASPQKEVQA